MAKGCSSKEKKMIKEGILDLKGRKNMKDTEILLLFSCSVRLFATPGTTEIWVNTIDYPSHKFLKLYIMIGIKIMCA